MNIETYRKGTKKCAIYAPSWNGTSRTTDVVYGVKLWNLFGLVLVARLELARPILSSPRILRSVIDDDTSYIEITISGFKNQEIQVNSEVNALICTFLRLAVSWLINSEKHQNYDQNAPFMHHFFDENSSGKIKKNLNQFSYCGRGIQTRVIVIAVRKNAGFVPVRTRHLKSKNVAKNDTSIGRIAKIAFHRHITTKATGGNHGENQSRRSFLG
jgi:hypothetical protein